MHYPFPYSPLRSPHYYHPLFPTAVPFGPSKRELAPAPAAAQLQQGSRPPPSVPEGQPLTKATTEAACHLQPECWEVARLNYRESRLGPTAAIKVANLCNSNLARNLPGWLKAENLLEEAPTAFLVVLDLGLG